MARLEIDLIGNNSSLIKAIQDCDKAFQALSTTAKNTGRLKVDLSLGNSIANLRTLNKTLTDTAKLFNDLKAAITAINSTSVSGITGGGTKAALDAQKLAFAQSKTEAQKYKEEAARLSAELARLKLSTAQSRQGTVAAIGSYKEAQQRLTALGKSIREASGGFDSTNPRVKAQIAAYRALNEELKKFDRLMGNNHRDVGNYRMALDGLGGQIQGLISSYISLYSAISLANKAFSTALKVDALQASFAFIISDSTDRIEALRQQANRLGVDFLTLTETNKKFIAAAKASNFSLTQADKIFNSVANAGAKLKLSNEQIGGTFLAIEQMISKGVVSMEELRRQLGDRLPGVFSLAAKAMGVTEMELNKLVSTGQVMSKDLLPKLADQLDKTYGNDTNKKIVSLQASTNRLNNIFTEIVMNSGVQSMFLEIVDSATSVVGIFNKLITTPLSKKLQDESRELAIMTIELDSVNTSSERRLELIQSLVAKYPAYLSHIDTEKISNSELLPILEKINASYAHRIAYQKLMEKAGNIGETQAQLQLDRFEAQQSVMRDIAKAQELINKYGINFKITGKTELEKAQNIIDGLFNASEKKVETNTQIGAITKSLERGMDYLKLYDNALARNGAEFDEASKKAQEFAKSVGMFDGTSRDATTQLDALQKTMIKIQDSPKLKRSEKDAFAHRLALAGYDSETQKKVLAEVESLEIERAEKATKAVKGLKDYKSQIDAIFSRSDASSSVSGLFGSDLDTEKIRLRYEKLYSDLDKVETKIRKDAKLTEQQKQSYLEETAKVRSELGTNEAKELSDSQIEFAEKTEQKLSELYTKAGLTRIKSREQELASDKAYWDKVEANAREYGITSDQLAELRKASEARINADWDAKMLNTSLTFQRRLNETSTQIAIRELNTLYKKKEEDLNKWVASQRSANKRSEELEKEANERRKKLQSDLYNEYEKIYSKQRNIDIQTAFDGDAFSVPLAKIDDQINELRRSFQGLTDGEVSAFQQKISELELSRQQLQLFQGTVDSISSSFGDLFGDAIFNTENALENLGKAFESVAKNIISGLIKIALRYAINQAIGTASMATTAAASSATAATIASAWATAAALVSAATFGANAATGGIALGALVASTKALSGFSKGGYTGNVGRSEIAGFVHGQEFVVNASATRDNLPLLRAINNGMDISGTLGGVPSSRYGKVDTSGANKVVIEQDTIRIGHDAIYISFKKGERGEKRYSRN